LTYLTKGDEIMEKVICVVDCKNELGEGVVWSPENHKVYWVDIEACELWQYDPNTDEARNWKTPERITCIAFREKGGLVAAFESGFYFFDLESGRREKIKEIEKDLPTTRLNDGRCDRQGRFIVGGVEESERAASISGVYRLDHDLSVHKLIDGVSCSNSICFSPDGKIMYFADTWKRAIWAYDYEPETGTLSDQRVFNDFSGQPGMPDGSVVDSEGYLWNAQWIGHRVVRFSPNGKVDRVVEVPVGSPTCIAFGGEALDRLFITTARVPLTPEQLDAEPLSGGLFSVEVGVKGLLEPHFLG
jgi:L-arabinonolactonase